LYFVYDSITINKLCGRPPQYAPASCKLTFDLLTLKVVSESRVTWATSVPILVYLGLSVLDLGPMYATDSRQLSDAHHRLMPPLWGGRNNRRVGCFTFGPMVTATASASISTPRSIGRRASAPNRSSLA